MSTPTQIVSAYSISAAQDGGKDTMYCRYNGREFTVIRYHDSEKLSVFIDGPGPEDTAHASVSLDKLDSFIKGYK